MTNPYFFGRYKLLREIGRGGMGIVYHAHDAKIDRDVALKVLTSTNETAHKRFLREARITSRLRHRNIVTLYEMGEISGRLYFAMELIQGESLEQLIQKSSLTIRKSLDIIHQVGSAIDYAHNLGVVHRDLKPANIMIAPGNVVKVTDFGIAKLLESKDSITKEGTILGSFCHMSPEQARGDTSEVGIQSDVYSMGATLYEMLTGQPLFDGYSAMELVQKVLFEEPQPPTNHRPGIPQYVEYACLKALEKDDKLRYKNVQEFLHDLPKKRRDAPPKKTKMTKLLPLGAVFIVLGALGWWIFPLQETREPGGEFSAKPINDIPASYQKYAEAIVAVKSADNAPLSVAQWSRILLLWRDICHWHKRQRHTPASILEKVDGDIQSLGDLLHEIPQQTNRDEIFRQLDLLWRDPQISLPHLHILLRQIDDFWQKSPISEEEVRECGWYSIHVHRLLVEREVSSTSWPAVTATSSTSLSGYLALYERCRSNIDAAMQQKNFLSTEEAVSLWLVQPFLMWRCSQLTGIEKQQQALEYREKTLGHLLATLQNYNFEQDHKQYRVLLIVACDLLFPLLKSDGENIRQLSAIYGKDILLGQLRQRQLIYKKKDLVAIAEEIGKSFAIVESVIHALVGNEKPPTPLHIALWPLIDRIGLFSYQLANQNLQKIQFAAIPVAGQKDSYSLIQIGWRFRERTMSWLCNVAEEPQRWLVNTAISNDCRNWLSTSEKWRNQSDPAFYVKFAKNPREAMARFITSRVDYKYHQLSLLRRYLQQFSK